MSMQNVELKVRVADFAEVQRALGGQEPDAVLWQRDTYFAGTQAGWRLKLREMAEAGAELIAYARPDVAGTRTSAYTRVPVPDPDALRVSLRSALGVRGVVEKTRTLFLFEHTRIHADRVNGLGAFVELETVLGPELDAVAGRAELDRIAKRLGLHALAPVPGSYIDLLKGAEG